MATVNDVIALAQRRFQDAGGVRWPAVAVLEPIVNNAVRELRKVRPDLFIGLLASGHTTLSGASTLPGDSGEYTQALADYTAGQVFADDTDESDAGKASAMFILFDKQVLGV